MVQRVPGRCGPVRRFCEAVTDQRFREVFLRKPFALRLVGSPNEYASPDGTLIRTILRGEYEAFFTALQAVLDYMNSPVGILEKAVERLELSIAAVEGATTEVDSHPSLTLVWAVGQDLAQAAMAFSLYVQVMEKRGSAANVQRQVKSVMSRAYDAHLEYRVAGQVRNILAHQDHAILRPEVQLAPSGPKLIVRLDKNLFISNKDGNPRVRNEIREINGDIELIAVMRNLLPVMRGLDKELMHLIYPAIGEPCSVIATYLREAESHGGYPQVLRETTPGFGIYSPLSSDVLDFVTLNSSAAALPEAA